VCAHGCAYTGRNCAVQPVTGRHARAACRGRLVRPSHSGTRAAVPHRYYPRCPAVQGDRAAERTVRMLAA
jgi:hypothetical protein